jgi:hypothetical protein
MKHQFLCALILMVGLCVVPVVAAQNQTDQPAASNPQGYDAADPADSPYSQAAPSANLNVPPELVLPAGTIVIVRLSDALSSDRNKAGDGFTAILDQPLVAQGWVAARRGQTVMGQVAAAEKAGHVKGESQLGVTLTELVMVDGSQVPVRTELIQSSAGPSPQRAVAGIAAPTGIGAVVGAAAGGGEGAAIGAAVGAAAGITGIMSTRGRATVLYPETRLTFRLQAPVTITTQRAQQAFMPVNQSDYGSAEGNAGTRRIYRTVESYPPPPYYYPPYYYSPYYYPGWGYYGYYGFGPTIVVGPRGYYGGRGFYRGRR